MSPLTAKAQSLKFESKNPWTTARRSKNSKEQEMLKINTEAQQSKKSSEWTQKLEINTPPEINSP
jgi:hypothetical protein